jgi:hypothetical protein
MAAASENDPLLSRRSGKSDASDVGQNTKLTSYDPHILGTWKAFLIVQGTVFSDPVIYYTVLKLLGVAVLSGAILFFSVPDPEKMDTRKFHEAVNFIKVFIAFMLGLFLNSCLARWYSIMSAITDLFLSIKKVSWTLNSCGVEAETRTRVQKLMVMSCYLLEGEVAKQWETDKESLRPHWESTCVLCSRQNLMTMAQKSTLETEVAYHNRSLAVWAWVGTLTRGMKGPGISPPMLSRIYTDCGEAIECLKKIKTFATLQLPFMYSHMLACLVQLNNILLALACGFSCAVSVGDVLHHIGLQRTESGHMTDVYRGVQALLVDLCCLIIEPMLYQAFLIIASTLADPFTNDKYGLPFLEYIQELTVQLQEMETFGSFKPKMAESGDTAV